MYIWERADDLSPERLEELRNQWFSLEDALEELAVEGTKLTVSSFRKREEQVDCNKEVFSLGKPEVKNGERDGKGRPPKMYNRAFIEALRSFAINDTYKQIEEGPVDYFKNNQWKEELEEDFKVELKKYIEDPKDIYVLVQELSRIVGDSVVSNSHALAGQNKFLIHQNKKLEDTKEYYIAMYRGVEENANLLHKLESHIKRDILESSELLSRKEVSHFKLTLNVNQKLEKIMKLLEESKENSK